jgi:gas vesicle protein
VTDLFLTCWKYTQRFKDEVGRLEEEIEEAMEGNEEIAEDLEDHIDGAKENSKRHAKTIKDLNNALKVRLVID